MPLFNSPVRLSVLVTVSVLAGLFFALAGQSFAAEIDIDCAVRAGVVRPLHGVNGGPLCQGETLDLSKRWNELAIPSTRLHDCEWPGGTVVDMHGIFPDPAADPESPASYRFARTDDYLRAVVASGGSVVYRLGESIEHSPRKHFVHPPADNARWAAAALGVIRHYNHGWADGANYKIRYWEIWNEPENRPVMWTGNDDQYFALYATAAKAIKKTYPDLKVGGPAVGAPGEVVDGKFQPTPFTADFVKAALSAKAPLDFFSFHGYANDPSIYGVKARAIRRWLDDQNLRDCELHLNEWNYLPDNDWGPQSTTSAGMVRRKWFHRQGGPEGAAFTACVLCDLQSSPIDVANFFRGDAGDFGLFDRYGVPNDTFYAFKAFRMLLDTPDRVQAVGCDARESAVAACLNKDRNEVTILLSNYRRADAEFKLVVEHLPWTGPTTAEFFLIDAEHHLESVAKEQLTGEELTLSRKLPAPSVLVVKLRRQ